MLENLPKPLTKEETYQLFKEYKKGNKQAKEKLIMHNMRLVINIANKNSTIDSELNKDLISAGTIGLMNAIRLFDTKSNNEFSTYAFQSIKNAINIELKKELKVNDLIRLDNNIITDEESKSIPLVESLISKDLPIEELIIEKIDDQKAIELIKKVFPRIPLKSQQIIILYYGFYKKKQYSQREIGKLLGISQAAVGAYLKKGLERIKKEIEYENTKKRVKKMQ